MGLALGKPVGDAVEFVAGTTVDENGPVLSLRVPENTQTKATLEVDSYFLLCTNINISDKTYRTSPSVSVQA